MKRNADEGIGQKQGGLNIRLFEGKVKGGNKMQKKTKVKLPVLLVSSPTPYPCPPFLFPHPLPLSSPFPSSPPPPSSLFHFRRPHAQVRRKAIFLSHGLATKQLKSISFCAYFVPFSTETELPENIRTSVLVFLSVWLYPCFLLLLSCFAEVLFLCPRSCY